MVILGGIPQSTWYGYKTVCTEIRIYLINHLGGGLVLKS